MADSHDSQGVLGRGEFVRLAYRLGRAAASGGLTLVEGPRLEHQLHLRRGYLTAAQVAGHWAPLGEILRDAGHLDPGALRRSLDAQAAHGGLAGRALRDRGAVSPAALETALRRQAELRLERLAAMASAAWSLSSSAPPPPRHAGGVPLSLASWARRHAEARLDAARAQALVAELAGQRLVVHKELLPEAHESDETDRRLVAALASPRRLDELEHLARVPRFRLLAFVHFLRVVGAVDTAGVGARPAGASVAGDREAAARRVLGVPAGADAGEIRRAYHRLARAVHPDARPDVTAAIRRDLELRFAALTDAYRTLTQR